MSDKIEGPFTRIAPDDFSKITFLGRVYYFDTAQMGWEFYYSTAKEQAARKGVEHEDRGDVPSTFWRDSIP